MLPTLPGRAVFGQSPKPLARGSSPIPKCSGAVTPIEGIDIFPNLLSDGAIDACVGDEEGNAMSEINNVATTDRLVKTFIQNSQSFFGQLRHLAAHMTERQFLENSLLLSAPVAMTVLSDFLNARREQHGAGDIEENFLSIE